MQRIRITIQALIGVTVIAGGMAALTPAAQALTIPVACSEAALVTAVTTANSSLVPDTLALTPGCTYSITASHGSAANGQEALPEITTPIEMTVTAGSTTTIRRASLLPFRIAEVSTTGSLTLTAGVTFTNGSAAGDGGAILNFGAVTLTGSSLSGNTATSNGGGIYNGLNGTLTTTDAAVIFNTAGLRGGGIAAINSTATDLTGTGVVLNRAVVTSGGVYRSGGAMTTTNSPIIFNNPNNCVGSVPAVPSCIG